MIKEKIIHSKVCVELYKKGEGVVTAQYGPFNGVQALERSLVDIANIISSQDPLKAKNLTTELAAMAEKAYNLYEEEKSMAHLKEEEMKKRQACIVKVLAYLASDNTSEDLEKLVEKVGEIRDV